MPRTRPARPAVTGAQIAADAMRWVGQGYVYGGDASQPGVWDCSSFVSYVLGHDLHLGLPGGNWGEPGFPPTAHGPVVTSYATWAGARTIPGPPQAGDLCCFVGTGASGHIGIATGPAHMVSALDTTSGTVHTPIAGYGPYGAPLVYRRVLGIPPGPGVPAPPGASPAQSSLIALLIVAAMAGAIVVGAAAAAGILVVGAGAGIKAVSSK